MEEEKVYLGEGIADEAKNVLNKETKKYKRNNFKRIHEKRFCTWWWSFKKSRWRWIFQEIVG